MTVRAVEAKRKSCVCSCFFRGKLKPCSEYLTGRFTSCGKSAHCISVAGSFRAEGIGSLNRIARGVPLVICEAWKSNELAGSNDAENVVPCAEGHSDSCPERDKRLQPSGRLYSANVDRTGPAQLVQNRHDPSLGF